MISSDRNATADDGGSPDPQMIISEWTTHYNQGRPHSALGPGLLEPVSDQVPPNEHRHSLPVGYRLVKRSLLGGLHYEYGLVEEAAWKRISSPGIHRRPSLSPT